MVTFWLQCNFLVTVVSSKRAIDIMPDVKPKKQRARHDAMFQKGASGNPGGLKRLPPDVREAKQLTSHEFTRAVNKFFYLKRDEITEKLKDPELTMIDLMVGSMVARAAKDQDVIRAQFLLDRSIGKVRESIDIKHTLDHIPNEKLILMAQEAIEILKEAEKDKPLMLEAEVMDDCENI